MSLSALYVPLLPKPQEEQKSGADRLTKRPALCVLVANLFMATIDLLNAHQLPSFSAVAIQYGQRFRGVQISVHVRFGSVVRRLEHQHAAGNGFVGEWDEGLSVFKSGHGQPHAVAAITDRLSLKRCMMSITGELTARIFMARVTATYRRFSSSSRLPASMSGESGSAEKSS